MQYYFKPGEVTSIPNLRNVQTVSTETGVSSASRVLILYQKDHLNVKTVVKLVDGSRVGHDVSSVVRPEDLLSLPIINQSDELKMRYTLEYAPEMEEQKTCYQVFIGNMYASNASMHYTLFTPEAILLKLSEAFKTNPKYPHAYYIKYTFKKEPQYVHLIGQ